MAENITDLMANGGGFSAAPEGVAGYASGFTAGGDWEEDARYDFTKANVNAQGVTPMPSQVKIDNFERTMAKLYIDLRMAEQQQQSVLRIFEDPTIKITPEDAEKLMASFDEGKKLEHKAYDGFRDALAAVCSSKPTRKQLGGLNHPEVIRFLNHIRRLLNPEV